MTRALLMMLMLSGVGVAQQSAANPTKTEVFEAAKVASMLQKPMGNSKTTFGGLLVEGTHYKVIPVRREAEGEVEVHAVDTDVFYVVEGDATFVTGGKVVDAKQTSPEETRGSRIEGGVEHALHSGDVVLIPNGEPHWFQKVSPGFRYLVVKAR